MNNRKNIHICHFTSVHNADDIRIYKKECVSLAVSGYQVTLIAPGVKSEFKNGVQVIGIGNRPSSRLKRMMFFAKKAAEKARRINADIYHFHDPELLQFAWGFRRDGKKIIYDSHEDVPKQILGKYWIPSYLRFPIAKCYHLLEDLIASRLNGIITATPIINERYLKVNSKSLNINNYPFLAEFDNEKINESRVNRICYVGGITEIRGAREMVLAMENLPNVKLILAGNFSPSTLQQELESLTGWKNVEYVGLAQREEVAKILSQCIAGLVVMHPLPNHVDAQPNKMFEYMSASLPVIASNFDLWREVIEGNNCGICVDPTKPLELTEAIKQLVNQPEKVKEYGNNGRAAVLSKYNWQSEELKLISFYDELLNIHI